VAPVVSVIPPPPPPYIPYIPPYTPDTTAPVLSSGGVEAEVTFDGNTAKITFTTNEAGTYYYVALPSGAGTPAPTAEEIIKAGPDNAGAPLPRIQPGQHTVTVSGLIPNTPYKVYLIVVDDKGNTSDILETQAFTPEYTPAGQLADALGRDSIDYKEGDDKTVTLTLKENTTIGTITVPEGVTFDTGGYTLTVEAGAAFTVETGAEFIAAGDVTVSGRGSFTVNAGAILTVEGNVTVSGQGSFTVEGKGTVSEGATFTVENDVTVSADGTFTVEGDVTVSGRGSFTAAGDVTVSTDGTFTVESNTTLTVRGSFTVEGGFSVNTDGVINVEPNGTLIFAEEITGVSLEGKIDVMDGGKLKDLEGSALWNEEIEEMVFHAGAQYYSGGEGLDYLVIGTSGDSANARIMLTDGTFTSNKADYTLDGKATVNLAFELVEQTLTINDDGTLTVKAPILILSEDAEIVSAGSATIVVIGGSSININSPNLNNNFYVYGGKNLISEEDPAVIGEGTYIWATGLGAGDDQEGWRQQP
jgi:hypothetical protein